MRKCHAEIVKAWVVGAPKLGRLENGVRIYETDGFTIWYRGSEVVRRERSEAGWVFLASDAGWSTPTSRAIINAAAEVAIGKHVVGRVNYEQIWYHETAPEYRGGRQTWRTFGVIVGFDFCAFHHAFARLDRLVPRIVCNNGFSMSVQASRRHYCTPKVDRGPYTRVEVGFPSAAEPMLTPFQESSDSGQCFGWVPLEVVNGIIRKHGGYRGKEPT